MNPLNGADPLQCYSVYGACLESSMILPELLAIAPTAPRWRFRTTRSLAPMQDAIKLGADRLYDDVQAQLFAHREGHRIVVDDTGSFELSVDHATVTWQEHATAWPDFVCAHLVGRVLGTALYLDGLLPLHGSAVATRDGAVAFLAPKGFGKSTLALALTVAGARLLTDDTLPVEPRDVPLAWPGVATLRVHDDAVAATGVGPSALGTRDGKRILSPSLGLRAVAHPIPLAAIYLLDPVEPDGAGAERVTMPPALAAIGVLAHVKIGAMLGPSAASPMLERAVAIARRIPVRRLRVRRDLAALQASAETILSWHGLPAE